MIPFVVTIIGLIVSFRKCFLNSPSVPSLGVLIKPFARLHRIWGSDNWVDGSIGGTLGNEFGVYF